MNSIALVFDALRRDGLIAKMNFSCCGSCAGYELADIADELVASGSSPVGVVFFHAQDQDRWDEGGPLHIRFGQINTEKNGRLGKATINVGKMVVAELKKQGVRHEWSGKSGDTILVHERSHQAPRKDRSEDDEWS